MNKKLFTLLLFLSAAALASTPTRPHRMRISEPDPIVQPLAVQQRVAAVLAPLVPYVAPEPLTASSSVTSTIASDLIHAAMRLVGSQYRSGSSGPSAFDCSGFTSYVFKRLGITLKRSSREQHTQGERVADVGQLMPGDLVFFGRGGRKSNRVNHVGIVTSVEPETGTFEFIHASSSQGVRVDKYPDMTYWQRQFVGGRRILGTDLQREE